MRILTHRKTRGKRNRTRHEINAEREKIHVVKGDTVRVVRGDDKGKEGIEENGKVVKLFPSISPNLTFRLAGEVVPRDGEKPGGAVPGSWSIVPIDAPLLF